MRRRILKYAAIGFLVGCVAGLLIPWLGRRADGTLTSSLLIARTGSEARAIVAQALLSGLYGVACMCGMLLYGKENWPLALATGVHYLLIAVLFVPLALLTGWTDNLADLLVMEAFQLIGFVLIWLVMYLRYRKEVRELNRLQREMNRNEGDKA